jgi:hypothetical protein
MHTFFLPNMTRNFYSAKKLGETKIVRLRRRFFGSILTICKSPVLHWMQRCFPSRHNQGERSILSTAMASLFELLKYVLTYPTPLV